MSYFAILIFSIVVLPKALREYKKDKNKNTTAKYLNLLLSILIFTIYISSVKIELREYLFNLEEFYRSYQSKIGFIPSGIGKLVWIFYVLICIVISWLSVLLALRKEYARKLFLKLLPVLWILESIQLYKYALKNFSTIDTKYLFLYILILLGIIIFTFFLLYYSRLMKSFFQYTAQESPSIQQNINN